MACRLIQKFNSNSSRILNLLNKNTKKPEAKTIFETMDRNDRILQESTGQVKQSVSTNIEDLYKVQEKENQQNGQTEQNQAPKEEGKVRGKWGRIRAKLNTQTVPQSGENGNFENPSQRNISVDTDFDDQNTKIMIAQQLYLQESTQTLRFFDSDGNSRLTK